MTLQTDLLPKINNEDYQRLILKHSVEFSEGEIRLLNEILEKFTFDVVQAQALAQAVMQQVRFDPNARVFTMRGVSRPEHTVEFFRPIISWLDAFVEEELRREAPVEPIRLVFDLDYFNSISSKYIMGIILKSKQLFPAENGLTIEWHYTPGDEENRGIGEDMSYIAGMGFLLLERES